MGEERVRLEESHRLRDIICLEIMRSKKEIEAKIQESEECLKKVYYNLDDLLHPHNYNKFLRKFENNGITHVREEILFLNKEKEVHTNIIEVLKWVLEHKKDEG